MAVFTTEGAQEQRLLEAARAGDEDAFARIVEGHRARLHAHCYRMLGSLHDAEDALQETLLRAWRGLPRFSGRSSVHTWLHKIATNACLDAIAKRPKRVLPVDYGPATTAHQTDVGKPLVESVWVEPFPDEVVGVGDGYAAPEARYEEREAVELAFIAALQHLPATQRAVLILREVLGFSAREVAESLETTVAAVNSSLQRARRTIAERLPEQSQQETLRELGDERARNLVESYVDAWRRGNVAELRKLLAEEAEFSMPPWASWWRGRDTIARFAEEAVEICAEARTVQTRANGQPAIAYYSRVGDSDRYTATAIDVLTFEGSLIKAVTAFVSPEIFEQFGLPPELG
jgi:RNA polymerase sigma-70 factor (ECF subfamily)